MQLHIHRQYMLSVTAVRRKGMPPSWLCCVREGLIVLECSCDARLSSLGWQGGVWELLWYGGTWNLGIPIKMSNYASSPA